MRRVCEGDVVSWMEGLIQRRGVLQAIHGLEAMVLSSDGRVRFTLVAALSHSEHEPSGVVDLSRLR